MIETKQHTFDLVAEHKFASDTFAAWDCVETLFHDFKPDAIFAMSDEIIAGVIPALKKLKVKIPEECSVIGISDGYLPKILDPQVTFLYHNGFALGKMAAEHLIHKLKHGSLEEAKKQLILPTELIIADSTI